MRDAVQFIVSRRSSFYISFFLSKQSRSSMDEGCDGMHLATV